MAVPSIGAAASEAGGSASGGRPEAWLMAAARFAIAVAPAETAQLFAMCGRCIEMLQLIFLTTPLGANVLAAVRWLREAQAGACPPPTSPSGSAHAAPHIRAEQWATALDSLERAGGVHVASYLLRFALGDATAAEGATSTDYAEAFGAGVLETFLCAWRAHGWPRSALHATLRRSFRGPLGPGAAAALCRLLEQRPEACETARLPHGLVCAAIHATFMPTDKT